MKSTDIKYLKDLAEDILKYEKVLDKTLDLPINNKEYNMKLRQARSFLFLIFTKGRDHSEYAIHKKAEDYTEGDLKEVFITLTAYLHGQKDISKFTLLKPLPSYIATKYKNYYKGLKALAKDLNLL